MQKEKSKYETMKNEYDDYKKQMEPFELLSEAEAEARKIEAEQKKKEAEVEKKRKKKEKEEKEAAKEAKGYETGITYEQLARTPDDYTGEKVKFKGKVIQTLEGDTTIQIRLAIDEDYDKIIYCEYEPSIVSSRVLENDIITIYGLSAGLISYNSTLGSKITIPSVYIIRIDQ